MPERTKRKKRGGKKAVGSLTTKWVPPSEKKMIEYAMARLGGSTQTEAYRMIFPSDSAGISDTMCRRKASRIEKDGAIAVGAVIALIEHHDIQQLNEQVDGKKIKKELVRDLMEGIREAVKQSPLAIHTCVHSVRALAEMLGLDSPKELTLKNGGVSDNYKEAPSSLADMSDEELDKLMKEID